MTTTQVEERPEVEGAQKLDDLLEEAALDGTRPAELVRFESRSGKGLLTIDPNQTDWTPAQRTSLKSIGIETEGREAVPIPHVLQFLHICQMRDLDPFLREAYLIVHGKIEQRGGQWVDKRKYTLVVGIDGFRKRGEDTGEYAGQVGPEWCGEDMVWKQGWNPKWGNPVAARVGIMRKGHDVPTYGVAMFEEFVAMVPEYEGPYNNRRKTGNMIPNDMWTKMPANQIAKCAEAQGFRKAFPRQMSGMYEPAEMERAQAEYKDQEQQMRDQVGREKRMAAYAAAQGQQQDPPEDVLNGLTAADRRLADGVVPGEVVEPSGNPDQEPVSAREAVQETMAGMQARRGGQEPQEAAVPRATDAQRLAWLVAEVKFLENVIGHSIELLAKRQIETAGKPIQKFTADELQRVVNPLRQTGIAKLRAAGREDEARAYSAARPGVAAPLSVLLGQPDATQERAPRPNNHQYVDNGGMCAVPNCERFEDDVIHAQPS